MTLVTLLVSAGLAGVVMTVFALAMTRSERKQRRGPRDEVIGQDQVTRAERVVWLQKRNGRNG